VSSPAGQRWGNSSRSRRGHPIGHLVQSITEQMAVLIKRHGRRSVPQHLLHHLDVGARRDRQRRGGMAQLVRVEAGTADLGGRGGERTSAEDRCA